MAPGHLRRREGADTTSGMRRTTGGFSLIELMIVIAIMAVLMAIALPSGLAMRRQNRRATCAANLKALGQALLLFREDYECFPPDSTEYLWTPEARERYYNEFGTYPPNYDPTSLVATAYKPNGHAFPTYATRVNPMTGKEETIEVRGLGLFTLYYIGLYSAALPPPESDPRFSPENLAAWLEISVDEARAIRGFNDPDRPDTFPWFKGAGYITELNTFHCPENGANIPEQTLADGGTQLALVDRNSLPLLPNEPAKVRKFNKISKEWNTVEVPAYWNNYDQFYRRNFWAERHYPGMRPPEGGAPARPRLVEPDGTVTDPGWAAQGERHLWSAYPPADAVVTWCPYHHSGYRPAKPGDGGFPQRYDVDMIDPGDMDLVLFADGSVHRTASRQDGRMFEAPVTDLAWPQGPVM